MILAKPLDRAISIIKYRLGKYYIRMGLTPPQVRVCRDFSTPPRDLFVINEWPLIAKEINLEVKNLDGEVRNEL